MEQNVEKPSVKILTAEGPLRVTVAQANGKTLLVAATDPVPEIPLVRFQSSCVFGEAFGAIDCDCGAQLRAALARICLEGGILIYAWEEGRGIGIADKLKAIELEQTKGLTTSQAFWELGHQPDPRDFEGHIVALQQHFRGNRIRLASSNPRKVAALERAGYRVERVKLDFDMTPEQAAYLDMKKNDLGHDD